MAIVFFTHIVISVSYFLLNENPLIFSNDIFPFFTSIAKIAPNKAIPPITDKAIITAMTPGSNPPGARSSAIGR